MMSPTLGMTGMDPATETALKAAFLEANDRLGGHWRLLTEAEAANVMVDMDSMYGPMSWLRLHAAGKRVIGLTTATRTQTDFRLGRPFDGDMFLKLLRDLAPDKDADRDGDAEPKATDAPVPEVSETEAATLEPESMAAAEHRDDGATQAESDAATAAPTGMVDDVSMAAAVPSGATPAPAPQDQLPKETLAAADADFSPPPEPVPDAVPVAPTTPARDSVMADWLTPGALGGRVRYRRDNGPTLLIDPVGRSYHGPSTLKPFAPYFKGAVRFEDFEILDDAAWARASVASGAAQPLTRLLWLDGLLAGGGRLLPEYDPDGRYQMVKWPQTEREYPRHFRIATAMMKGPATLAGIAGASDMPLEDVADFVNANLATGYAEYVPETPPEPEEPVKPTGLFGRLRGR